MNILDHNISALRKTHSQPHSRLYVNQHRSAAANDSTGGDTASEHENIWQPQRTRSIPRSHDCDYGLVQIEVSPELKGAGGSRTKALFAKLRSSDRKTRSKSGSPQCPKRRLHHLHNLFDGIRNTLAPPPQKTQSHEDLMVQIRRGWRARRAESGEDGGSSISGSESSSLGGMTTRSAVCVATSSSNSVDQSTLASIMHVSSRNSIRLGNQ